MGHVPEAVPAPSPAERIVDDVSAFKIAFRRLAAGVSVITTLDPEGAPRGFTATSLASLAAVPPLATFNMARTASTWPAVDAAEHVIIHLLGAANREVAGILSGPQEKRFEGDHWAPGPHGLPLLKHVPAWMLARVVERHHVAGGAVVVVQIEDGGLGGPDDAIVYHERTYFTPSIPA
ncbi:flavin reductase family protein [Schumannella luteola]|nr:flavin reductase family protein [Schumannella luteola]